jgi:Legionella pneumophila major outer membrane protein precursor
MQSARHGLRITLLAGVSVVALAAASPNAGAADVASPPVYKKAPPPLPPQSTWSWWIEGGAFNTGGGSVGFPAFKTNWGGEGAIGFDWQAQPLWHVLGQFRYGTASKSPSSQFSFISGPSTVNVSENQNLREDHWLVDFGVGRDFGLGNNAMWTLGVRVADLRSKLSGNFNISTVGPSPSPTTIAIQEKSTFVGAGPRLGVQGDTPLGGQWSIDWQAGAAALIGERTLTITANTAGIAFAGSQTDTPVIFNVDAQVGLSYWLNTNLKFTAGYRFDDYFKALKTATVTSNIAATTPTVTTTNIDRSYSGPVVRLTSKF